MAKLQITNRQAEIIAQTIYSEIKTKVDADREVRKTKLLPGILTKVKKSPIYVALLKNEKLIADTLKNSKAISEFITTNKLGSVYSFFGTDLSDDTHPKASDTYLKKVESDNFPITYPVTKSQIESDIVMSVLGADDLTQLVSAIKAKYLK